MDMKPDDNQDLSQPEGDATEPQTPEVQDTAAQQQPPAPHPSREDALADMRRSLREEEGKEKTGFGARFSRLMQRIFRRKRKTVEEEVDVPSRLDELQFPEPPAQTTVVSRAETAPAQPATTPEVAETPHDTHPLTESKVDFGNLVRNKLTDAFTEKEERRPVPPVPDLSTEEDSYGGVPNRSILATLRQEDELGTEEQTNIRQEALEDYSTEPEVPDEDTTSLPGRLKRSWRYMRPTEKRLLIGVLVLLGIVALAGTGFAVVQAIPTPAPVMTPTTSVLPVPISVSLPGGWVFPLRTGAVVNGKWNPAGPEWLGGTEVCRWVSLPWTVQLEAVLRTLQSNDPIQLSMSNYDSLTYKVQSIEQVPSADIAKLATDSPCLLLILSKNDSDNRWVVTAKP